VTIILEENLPRGLLRMLAPRTAATAQQAGYAGMENGQLLAALEGVFDILITADKNLRYQHTAKGTGQFSSHRAVPTIPEGCQPLAGG